MSSLRQQTQVPAAFEIRFSTTDSILEVFEIQSDQSSQNVPDPFKKRDKIPRSSGSIEQFSNFNNNNHNNTAPPQATPIVIKQKQRHHSESSSKKGLSSDQVSSSLKVKSSNAVGPEADKQQQHQQQQHRVNGVTKNFNVERSSSLGNDMIMTANITMDDDPIIRSPNNKRQRPKIDEFVSEMDKNSNLGKAISNNQFMDLSGKADMVIPNNKKITPKSTIKNKINNMPTNSHKDDEKLLPKDGIATPPATPPRSPYIISQKRSEDGISKEPITIKQINSEEPQSITPPSSSGSTEFVNDLVNDLVSTKSTPRATRRPSKASQSSRKRRGSHSPQKSESMLSTKRSLEMSAYQPPKKLQYPRGRRLSLASGQITTAEQPQESFATQSPNKSKEIQKSQQPQSPITRSRIPRLSTSSKERPIVSQKISQGSLSSQGSNKYNESMELSSSYPGTSKPEPPRNIRTSRPIINTTFISDVEMRSESPTGCSPTSHSPTDYSPTNSSPTNYSPTSFLSSSNPIHQKKLISHDDVVIPTIAKKLKMKGQLHFVSHDALLGYSDEPEVISPMSENGYMDITDQVVNLFDGPKNKSHKKQSIPDSQHRRQRKNSSTGHSRNSSKTHYIAPRKQPPQQNNEEVPSPTSTQFENSSEHSVPHDIDIKNKRGRSRREEYIISVREDDDDMELIEPRSSMSLVPSEPSTVPAVQIESHDQIYQEEKVEEPVPVQIPVVEEVIYNPTPAEVVSAPAATSGMKKKDKKKKQKKGGSDNLDEEDKYVRRSRCRCAIQ